MPLHLDAGRAHDMLRRGDLVSLRYAVAAVPHEDRCAQLRLADLEAAVRLQQATLADIDILEAELSGGTDPADDALRWWAATIRAEYLFWHGDLLAIPIAAATLAEMPQNELPPVLVLIARARVRRILAIGHLFTTGFDTARRELDLAVADFVRAGWEEERALTVALFAISRAGFFLDDLGFCEAITAEACDRLRTTGSPQLPLILATLAMVRFLRGDMWAVHRALDELDRVDGREGLPSMVARYLRALAALIGTAASDDALAAVETVGDDVRRSYPAATGTLCVGVAAVLADFGRYRDARRWVDRAALAPTASPLGGYDVEVLELRLRIAAGEAGVVGALTDALVAMDAAGVGRDAAQKALRAARDCVRMGDLESAWELWSWGVQRLPPEGERSTWDALFAVAPPRADAAPTAPDAGAATTPVLVNVLCPDIHLVAGADHVRVEGSVARLLGVLAALGGCATSDRLIEHLWPGAPPAAGRNRLNVTVHRARRTAEAVVGRDVIVRRGNVVELDVDGVDAWEFARGVAGDQSAADRRAALESYTDHLGGRALAYDDAVHEERLRLAALWVDTASALLEAGEIDPVLVADRVATIGFEDFQLTETLARHLAAAGCSATASVVFSNH